MNMDQRKLFLILLLFFITINLLATVTMKELRAAYIERFTRFIKWPNSTQTDFFTIAVYNDEKFARYLETFLSQVTIKDKLVKVINVDSLDEHLPSIFYIGSHWDEKLQNILRLIEKEPVLVIGETLDQTDYSPHLNFFVLDKKLRFSIDQEAFKQSNLEVGYQLLQVSIPKGIKDQNAIP